MVKLSMTGSNTVYLCAQLILTSLYVLEANVLRKTRSGLQCYSCSNMTDADGCTKVLTCDPGQLCIVRRTGLDTTNRHLFEASCDTSMACVSPQMVGKRDSDCARCCSNDLCNNHCGDARDLSLATISVPIGTTTTAVPLASANIENSVLHCYSCDLMFDVKQCEHVVECQQGYMCLIHSTQVNSLHGGFQYKAGCEKEKVCQMTEILANSGYSNCAKCCNTDKCNNECNVTLTTPITTTAPSVAETQTTATTTIEATTVSSSPISSTTRTSAVPTDTTQTPHTTATTETMPTITPSTTTPPTTSPTTTTSTQTIPTTITAQTTTVPTITTPTTTPTTTTTTSQTTPQTTPTQTTPATTATTTPTTTSSTTTPITPTPIPTTPLITNAVYPTTQDVTPPLTQTPKTTTLTTPTPSATIPTVIPVSTTDITMFTTTTTTGTSVPVLQCYSCDYMDDPMSCRHSITCLPGYLCLIRSTNFNTIHGGYQFKASCENDRLCKTAATLSLSGHTNCAKCCDTDNCNNECTIEIETTIQTTTIQTTTYITTPTVIQTSSATTQTTTAAPPTPAQSTTPTSTVATPSATTTTMFLTSTPQTVTTSLTAPTISKTTKAPTTTLPSLSTQPNTSTTTTTSATSASIPSTTIQTTTTTTTARTQATSETTTVSHHPTTPDGHLHCYACANMATPQDCRHVTICSEDEVCFLYETANQHGVLFHSRCNRKQVCNVLSQAPPMHNPNTGQELCHTCCSSNLCNTHCDFSHAPTTPLAPTRPPMTTTTPPDNTLSTTLTREECEKHGYVFLPYIDLCFKLHFSNLTWNEAKHVCLVEGAKLAVVDNDAKFSVLQSMLAYEKEYNNRVVFIGGSDVYNNGGYVWENGAQLTSDYLHNKGISQVKNSRCLAFASSNHFAFSLEDCQMHNPFICTKP
ncbi:mucin-2-like [Dreissena polymorpha]|uniref:mucin-2-like n=1 Tax=Dreissena polymorpha TaxID=45954 RepID=UPI002264078D|nr:mucin-2-like [Dreissena polymorpha]